MKPEVNESTRKLPDAGPAQQGNVEPQRNQDPSSEEKGAPEAQETATWQGELREQADPSSAGSDESSANTIEPAATEDVGLHRGLVR